MAEKIQVPEAPAGLPVVVAKKWKVSYESAMREAMNDWPDDETTQRQVALREANRLLKTPDLASHGEAMGLEDWHFVLRQPSQDGKTLRVVTRHGKKYTFPIPVKQQKAAATPASDKGATGTGASGAGDGDGK